MRKTGGIRKPSQRRQADKTLKGSRRTTQGGAQRSLGICPAGSRSAGPFQRRPGLPDNRISNLDKLYCGVSAALDNLLEAVGLNAA